ncbi:hypothetical protein QYF36_017519 [Acer negundo]|nr:hypothetical protein QYF36_017519 [Acer negundo]
MGDCGAASGVGVGWVSGFETIVVVRPPTNFNPDILLFIAIAFAIAITNQLMIVNRQHCRPWSFQYCFGHQVKACLNFQSELDHGYDKKH